jgi:aconitate hydratase 2/2-methylisocitrate dehydratase
MGKDAQVYLGSAELAAVCALLGRIPTVDEYQAIVIRKIDPFASDLYRYLHFDQISNFEDQGRVIPLDQMPRIEDILGMPVAAK